jgi:hypothetical protein
MPVCNVPLYEAPIAGNFVGDYSYSKIVSSHEMFEKVQRCLNLVVCDFRMVKNGALSFLRCLNEFMIGDIFEMKGRAVS